MRHQVTLTDDSTSSTCLSVLKHISSLMVRGENFDNAVRLLCSIAKLDGYLCVAEDNLLFYNEAYKSADSALMSMPSLQCLATLHDGNFETQSVVQALLPTGSFPINIASYVCITWESLQQGGHLQVCSKIQHDFREIGRFHTDNWSPKRKYVLDSFELAVIVDKFAAVIIKLCKAVQRHLALVISLRVKS